MRGRMFSLVWTLVFVSQCLCFTTNLTAKEKKSILSLWKKIAPIADELGSEAFARLFLAFPQTKSYFCNFDVTPGSDYLMAHGGKVMRALGNAANHLNDLPHKLSDLAELHTDTLQVDPGIYGVLSHCIEVTLAVHFPKEFTAEVQAAWIKFLNEVSYILSGQYRSIQPAE